MTNMARFFRCAAAVAALASTSALAQQVEPPVITRATQEAYAAILQSGVAEATLKRLESDEPHVLADQIALSEIAAPSFKEMERARVYADRMRQLGLTDVSIDSEGNVIGVRPGTRPGPTLVLSAHLDTVFPEGANVGVTKRDGRYYGLGVSDDGRGLAVVLGVLRALQQSRIQTVGTVLFVATVGEEGLGNLRGVKALLRDRKEIDGFITIEPSLAGGERLGLGATGSRRWEITFEGPGGHSFVEFGLPSAIHAMGRSIAHISDLRPVASPKTTFTVGIVAGGTSVNTISASARMEVDIRSNGGPELAEFETKLLAAIDRGTQEENARWGTGKIEAKRRLIGDRPAGSQRAEGAMIEATFQAFEAVGDEQPELVTVSTDSNAAIALGIPATTLTGGGISGGLHSQGEWFSPDRSWRGTQRAFLTTLALVGLAGVSKPLLKQRPRSEAKAK